jgi:hypothetical protein
MKGKTYQEKGNRQNHNTARLVVSTRSVMNTGDSPVTASAVNMEDVPITVVTVGTENDHTIGTVITHATTIRGADIAMMVIGDPGINGKDMKESTLT